MYSELLKKAGLTGSESEVLDYLYTRGVCKASTIAVDLKRPRAAVYKVLENLIHLGLAEKISKLGKIDTFRAEHPSQLEKLYEDQEKKLSQTKKQYQEALPDLISNFNLAHNKPGVRFYEGEDGVIKAFEQISKKFKEGGEILSLTKTLPETSDKQRLKEALDSFVKRRISNNIKTRVIATESKESQTLKNHDSIFLRETKIAVSMSSFISTTHGEIIIYKNEILQVVNKDEVFFALIIENKHMSQLMTVFFELFWSSLA